MTRQTCSICCEQHRVTHSCGACDTIVCRPCARRAAEEGYSADACLACGARRSLEGQRALLGITFVSVTLRRLRQTSLLRRQQALYDATLPLVAQERRRRELRGELRALNTRIQHGHYELWATRQRILRDLQTLQFAVADIPTGEARWCAHAGCCGVLASSGRCVRCERVTCLRCESVGGDGHVCDPQIVANVNAVRRECRSCVRCHAPSTRVEGCPVMWCPRCHAFWNWDSRTLLDTRRHTPHNPDHRTWLHAQRMSAGTRELGDIPCGGLPQLGHIDDTLWRVPTPTVSAVSVVLRALLAAQRAQELRYTFAATWNEEELTLPLRVGFLLGDLTERRFAQRLEHVVRAAEGRAVVHQVLTTFVYAVADILQCVVAGVLGFGEASDSLRGLRGIANEALTEAQREFHRSVPRLDTLWEWSSTNSV